MRLAILLLLALQIPVSVAAAPRKVLFDNTHAETAGNADWQIDTDQPLPVPDQSTVTPATPRTYWLGAISSWAIDLVKRGYSVASLTAAHGISYGNAANPYDLSQYDVFIVDEPNTRFSAAESTAILNFVRDGGGLIAIADHLGSDRDGNGIDSPRIWDALDASHHWGMSFDTTSTTASNFSDVWSTNVTTAPDDSIVHGPYGLADGLEFHNGTSIRLYPSLNASVRGTVWRTGFAHDSTGLMAARSVYGNGRIVFVGDSSPADDGSAAPGNSNIFDGWGEAAGRDSLLFLNATAWAARREGVLEVPATEVRGGRLGPARPNPAHASVRLALEIPAEVDGAIEVLDLSGRRIRTLLRGPLVAGRRSVEWDGRGDDGVAAPQGVYFVRARWTGFDESRRLVRLQ